MATETTILLVRHGARHDYANKELWQETCAKHGHEVSDPPLSALGHQQAREVAAALKDLMITHILCSPYLRVIQTAQPLAHALSKPLLIENGLAELHHKPSVIPLPGVRIGIFPEVDPEYDPMLHSPDFTLDKDGVESDEDYLRRLIFVARELPKRHAGATIACFSHAGSLGLVAALTGCKHLTEAGCFAPCGIWKLVSSDGGKTWIVAARGDDNTGHCSYNDPSTYAWGFEHSGSSKDAYQAAWERALALGPTTVGAP